MRHSAPPLPRWGTVPKVLSKTFKTTNFVGKNYVDSILIIYDGDELIDTLYWIEEYRAEYEFEYHYGDKAKD